MVVENPIPSESLLLGREGNIRGVTIEQKVAGLIGELPFVSDVVQTEKWTREDKDMIDLIVILDSGDGLTVGEVFVQIKASTKGVEHFEERLAAMLKQNNVESGPVDRKLWMLENHRIILNGDLEMSKSRKHKRHITDEEIISSFQAQLLEIDSYEKAKMSEVA